MATHEFAEGQVRVEAPASVQVRERDESQRALPRPSAVKLAELSRHLQENGFEVVADLDMQSTRSVDRAAIAVTPAPDRVSVVLTERDGLLQWQLPEVVRPVESQAETFSLRALPGVALVLRFAAPLLTGSAIKALESDVTEGLVHIAGADRATWTPLDSLDDLDLGADARILLLVHGTFSSTDGGFVQLTADGPGRAFLDGALTEYDAVIGFDHRTLSVDPLANAQDLFDLLCARAPRGTTVDIVTHSRGGLVARALVERVLPRERWDGRVDRIVFVGVPNAGTNFAEPQRWSQLVDLYINILTASSPVGAVLSVGVKRLGVLVKYLAAYFVDGGGVPGLAAMEPDGDFVKGINRLQTGQPGPVPPWFSVSSDFHIDRDAGAAAPQEFPRAFALWLAEGVVDDLLDGANDLVVDTDSMSAVDRDHGEFLRDRLHFASNAEVYHLNYFAQDRVCAALQAWLLDRRDTWREPAAAPMADDVFERAIVVGGGGVEFAVDFQEPGALVGAAPPEKPVHAHVRAEMSSKITVEVPLAVRVMLSRNEIKISPDTITAADTFDMDTDEVLDVELKVKRNLTVVDGKTVDAINLPAGSGVSTIEFTVVPIVAGPVELTVLLRRRSGEIVATLTLSGDARNLDDPDRRRRAVHVQMQVAAATSAVLDDAVWLEVWQVNGPGFVQFEYTLRLPGPTPPRHFTSPELRDHDEFVADLYAAIEAQWTQNSDRPKVFREFLQRRGSDLFERLFPEDMQAALWALRDELSSILLLADEPYFPWEIVHLKPPVGPRQQKPRFLAQYGLLRWQFLPFPATPELRARPGKVFALCPQRVDPRLLLIESLAEAKFLVENLGACDLKASPSSVRRLLKRGDFDVLHFSGHGTAEVSDVAEARIMLDDRKVAGEFVRQFLSATDVSETAKLSGDDGTGPLVVLNACQAGLGAVQLSSLGGFARAFLAAGAQAFVGCLWSVEQQPSRVFTQALYHHLLAGLPLGQAVVRAREDARAHKGAETWLAYVVYGRLDATLVLQ